MTQSSQIEILDHAPAVHDMLADVIEGLQSHPRHLPSRYLYDERGAQLFERICELDEYYLTRTEQLILEDRLPEISRLIGRYALVFEPGSGAGVKTRMLLDSLCAASAYVPIDISREQLLKNAADLAAAYPEMDIVPVCADFMNDFPLPLLARRVDRTVAFFPGSTIGNLLPEEAVGLLKRFRDHCAPGGFVLIGIDLLKDRRILEAAYDDAEGISAEFALNFLVRLNRELDAEFDTDRFGYEAVFNERLSRIEMSLISLEAQSVRIGDFKATFERDERIRTEVSCKYSLERFGHLAARAGLTPVRTWTDAQKYFGVILLATS